MLYVIGTYFEDKDNWGMMVFAGNIEFQNV